MQALLHRQDLFEVAGRRDRDALLHRRHLRTVTPALRRVRHRALGLGVRSNPADRGSQFRSRAFVSELHGHGLQGSMGRVGACGDNAAMESFFALLQKNVLDRQRWATRDELRLAIITWIEKTYHRRRRQRRLGRLTPIEFETILSTAAEAA